MDPDDIWNTKRLSATGCVPDAGQESLLIEELPAPRPLGSQIGRFPKLNVPEFLDEALFGDQPEGENLLSYALLDAGRAPGLLEMLENSGLEHRCLFKGKAFDELKDVAPWIVRLDRTDNFTRNLFTQGDAAWHLWDADPGIYLRTCAPLDEIWHHLRKFTRQKDSQEKWLFVRFWETGYLHLYLRHFSASRPDLIKRICVTREGSPITYITCSFGKEIFHRSVPRDEILAGIDAAIPTMDDEERQFFKALRDQQKTYEMAHDLRQKYPHLMDLPMREVYRRVHVAKSFMNSIGVTDGLLIGRYILLTSVYMPNLQESQAFRDALARPGGTPEGNLRDSLDVLKLHLSRTDAGFQAWW